MTPQVTSYAKPEPIRCQDVCGDPKCTSVGQPTKRLAHVRGCCCVRCRNRSNNKRGGSRQSTGWRRLNVNTAKFIASNEEALSGPLRYEHKDGGKARTVVTAYERERAQSAAARSIGDNRPFVAGYSVDGKHSYYVIRDDDLSDVLTVLSDAWGFGEDTGRDAVAAHVRQENTASGHRP